MSPTAKNDRNRTPLIPKYSLMMSVMIKTTGHITTPAVRLKLINSPNTVYENESNPKVFSNEKIFTPINSAIIAFETKKPPKIRNNMFSFFSKMFIYLA